MSQNIVIVLCEGLHDVAFLVKILRSSGYEKRSNCIISEFPSPYDALLCAEATKSNIASLNMEAIRKSLFPSEVLLKNGCFFFLYDIGGIDQPAKRKKLFGQIYDFMPQEIGEKSILPDNTTISLLYFLDADKKGIANRIGIINKEINDVIGKLDAINLNSNDSIISLFGGLLNIGAYIFTDDDGNYGDLEDIMISHMKKDNESIFDDAAQYLNNHFNENRLFPLKLTVENGIVNESRTSKNKYKNKYDENKSLLGVVGQLQKSGGSNTVCIGQTDYLTLAKIRDSAKCKSILAFFDNVIATISR